MMWTADKIIKLSSMRLTHTRKQAAEAMGLTVGQVEGATERYKIKFKKVGENHHSAKHTDHDIELCRQLIDDGMSIREAARKMEISYGYLWSVLDGRYRACI